MIEEQALVTRIKEGQVFITSMQSSACQHCAQHQSCGTAHYAKVLPNREIALFSTLPLNVGDTVIVGIEESHLLRASLFMYLLPLLLMLITVGLFDAEEQAISALLAFFSLFSALYLIHRLQSKYIDRFMAAPQVIRKL